MLKQNNRVLIVDDDPVTRNTFGAFLARENYILDFAANGEEALAQLKETAPDAILLDIMMPGIDGIEVCRIIKNNPIWQHIPVILITAFDSEEDMVAGLDAGADEFLSKPVSGSELRARLRAMLRIKKQYDVLQDSLRLREDLANMIMHDMRSPLTSILLIVGLLREKAYISTDELHKYLRDIETQARWMSSFFNDMLIMTKMEAGKLLIHPLLTDINLIALAIEENHRVMAQSKCINLVVEKPAEKTLVPLDEPLFQRALDNLVSNALKFSPPHTTITLRVQSLRDAAADAGNHAVRIQVIDEGPGVLDKYRERIFDKFEIVTMKKDEGIKQFGLGLPFCKMVVEAHGGHIFVEANKPSGAIFTVEV